MCAAPPRRCRHTHAHSTCIMRRRSTLPSLLPLLLPASARKLYTHCTRVCLSFFFFFPVRLLHARTRRARPFVGIKGKVWAPSPPLLWTSVCVYGVLLFFSMRARAARWIFQFARKRVVIGRYCRQLAGDYCHYIVALGLATDARGRNKVDYVSSFCCF